MNKAKVKVGIVGSTGYSGVTLIELLLKHPNVKIEVITSEQHKGKKFSDVYPAYKSVIDPVSNLASKKCEASTYENLSRCDLVFFATPNGIAHKTAPRLIKAGIKVIDLSADYRFRNLKTYEKWYGFKRSDKDINKNSIYGLVELKRDEIEAKSDEASLAVIGNPGCYTTASILALAPILHQHAKSKNKSGFCDLSSIIIDAKSGISGAGRKASVEYAYTELNDSLSAYALAGAHRHTPEIEAFFEEYLYDKSNGRVDEKIALSFSPHLIPMNCGILATCYINLNDKAKMSDAKLKTIYTDFYGKTGKGESFVEVLDKGIYPQTKWVTGTNNVMMHVDFDKRSNRAIITCAIDNLIKGAAGQAIQNMNLILGLAETTGLELSPHTP